MSISVTITKDDQGNFTVAQEDPTSDVSKAPAAPIMPTDPNAPPAAPMAAAPTDADADTDGTKGQPAPDLKSALLMAAKMLMSDNAPSAYQSAFDSGMAKNNPGSLQGGQ